MQYNPNCVQPLCFLTLDNGKEEQRSLQDIQAYIESENKRLEKDPTRSFDPREINIRMEYKYCPNMIMIDTPGMIQPPRGRQSDVKQRAIQQQSKEAEQLILSKIRCQDYIILCVEDTTDWKHATTRNIVTQADPTFSRTVLVSTKLDTKLPQWSDSEDVMDFLNPQLISDSFKEIMGGPFHTSVPSGRVGVTLVDNEEFVAGIKAAEAKDRSVILGSFKTSSSSSSQAVDAMNNVGVSRLRTFLEAKVEECYRKNVARIVPLLQNELKVTEKRIKQIEKELESLSSAHLKKAAMLYRDRFIEELALVIQGTVRASAAEFGETLEMEQLRGGVFYTTENDAANNNDAITLQEQEVVDIKARAAVGKLFGNKEVVTREQLPDAKYRLFGGAQYHRALKEFNQCVRTLPLPRMTAEDVANAAGMASEHDGADYMRAACVIAMEKAKETFDPILNALEYRADYIMKRVFPIVSHLLTDQENKMLKSKSNTAISRGASSFILNKMKPFQRLLQRIYDRFVEETLSECTLRCRDDLNGMTEFVTFDMDDRGGSNSLYNSVPTPKKVSEIYVLLDQELKKQQREEDIKLQQLQYQREQRQREQEEELLRVEELEENEDKDDDVEDLIAKEWAAANGGNTNKKNSKGKTNSKASSSKANAKDSAKSKVNPVKKPFASPSVAASKQQQVVSLAPPSQDSDVEVNLYHLSFFCMCLPSMS